MSATRVLAVERVEVGDRELEAVVRVPDEAYLRTSAVPGIERAALALLPGLARHTCENDAGLDAVRELADTETPHLLEHVAAELMALSGSPRTLRAATGWDFQRDGRGVFRVRLGFDVDLVALAALREAAAIVEWLFTREGDTPDVSVSVARMRTLREGTAPR